MDLFVLGHRARLKLGEIRSILETLPMVQISSNLGKLTNFILPKIEHNIRFQLHSQKMAASPPFLLAPAPHANFFAELRFALGWLQNSTKMSGGARKTFKQQV